VIPKKGMLKKYNFSLSLAVKIDFLITIPAGTIPETDFQIPALSHNDPSCVSLPQKF
jgi:hypothetical protein